MKSFWVIFVGLLAMIGFGQTKFFSSVTPQATVVVKQHPMGADLVEVTVLGSAYSQDALEKHIDALGAELGMSPRGTAISVIGNSFVKATFAVPGLIQDKEPKFNLPAIAKAFAFGDAPITQFSVIFMDMVPDSKTPAFWFAPKDAWMMEGVGTKSPLSIEYRVKVNTKNPVDVFLPGPAIEKKNKETQEAQKKPDFVLIGAIAVAAISIGVLVYSAVIRGQRKSK
jgi:hypothetical protein